MKLIGKLLRSIYLLLNVIVIAWLFICKYASLHDPSSAPSMLSLLSFSTLFAFLANVGFIFIWLLSKKKLRSLFSIIALIACWNLWSPILGWNYFGSNKTESTEGGLKIMSWNVHLFDLGEWTNDHTSKAKIIKLIQDENPDILVLQEFFWDEQVSAEPYTAVIQQLGYPYVKMITENTILKRRMNINAVKNERINIGNAIFSKYPLVNENKYSLGKTNYKMLNVDVVFDSLHTFDLNVVHLTSVGFHDKDIDFIDDVKAQNLNPEVKSQSKKLLKKLMNASAQRAILANHIDSLKRFMDNPIIICGDFNDVPSSYVYRTVRGDLADAFQKKGVGLGRTYQKIFPTLRIDYILFDDNVLKAEGYLKQDVGLSDHYPIIATFSFREIKERDKRLE